MCPILKSVSSIYKNESHKVRIHNFIRAHTCPFEKISEYIGPSQNILDLGCGNGLFMSYLSVTKSPLHLTGIDISKSSIDVARRSSTINKSFLFTVGDICEPKNLIGKEGRFDCILAIDSLYFLPASPHSGVLP